MSNSEHAFTASASTNTNEKTSAGLGLSSENQQSIERQSQIGFDPERLIPNKTYVEVGIEKLTSLCDALGMNAKLAEVVEIFRAMTISWSDRQVGESVEWPSDVSDDGSPFEFSIALDPDKVELRVLVEAQGKDANLQSNWQAGLELNQYLATHYNVSLDRFAQIADLFVPTNAEKPSAFKLYLNPQSQHKSRSAAIVEESLVRLGFTHAWPTLAETAAQRGPDKDEFVYFSLDLAAHTHSRVKVYLRHHDATPSELESALSAARNYVPGDAIEFCQAMAPGQTSFSAKPAISAFSWVESDNATPSSSTLHIPISNYAIDDRAVCDRLDLYLIEHNIPISKYQSVLKAFAKRSLETGVGMHSYTSLRREKQQRRVALYLNPEINVVRSSAEKVNQSSRYLPSLEELVWHYEEHTVAHHPFLQRLQREPVNPQHLWLLFANIHEAVVPHFTRWLANIIARLDDERIRSILVKQLNEELGNGNTDRTHRRLFEQLMSGIEDWRVTSFTTDMLIPGKEFSNQLEKIYLDSNPYVGVGAVTLMEIHAKQFDLCVGEQFRKTDVNMSVIKWLTLHEELEVDHADESLDIARFIADSEEGVIVARRSVEITRTASWKFLDSVYRLCYYASPVTI
jgi:pyrroloquinoline quinone (PQQ) biosynthesis protein C